MTMSVIVVRRDAELGEHADRRDPVGNAELVARNSAPLLVLHEAGVDQHVAVAAPREDEGEGQVDDAVGIHAVDEVDPRLVLRPREFDDVEFPVAALQRHVRPF